LTAKHLEPWSINRPEVKNEVAAGNFPVEVLDAGRKYLMSLKVTAEGEDATVAIDLDGEPWMSWSGKHSELHDGPIVLPEPDRIGLAAAGSFVLHRARLRVTSGNALLVTPAQGSMPEQPGANAVLP
jgi:hypothetical protein